MSPDHVRFVHLHVHSEYSLLDGANRIKLEDHHRREFDEAVKQKRAVAVKPLLHQVRSLGMSAAALTDHGNMCGSLEFYREARREGLKAILGMEAYVAPGSRLEKTGGEDSPKWHLTLLAQNETGLRNLTILSSLGHEEGFYYRPRIDRELLAKHHDGLIALSGCLSGEVATHLLKHRAAEAAATAAWYKELLGPDRYFIELMDHGLADEKLATRGLVEIAGKLGLGTVATNDAHYLERADALAHEVLLCIQTAKTMDATDRMRLPTPEFYLKSPQEMAALFAEIPDAVTRSWEIAERCGLELVFADDKGGKLKFPPFEIPEGYPHADAYLQDLCLRGAQRRYGGTVPGEVAERLAHELDVIRFKGFSTYFLIVWDIVRTAKERGILVGPGRGSAAGSLTAYVLGITDLDPLKYDLIFERMLNPERAEPPDIDIDFPDNRREEVVAYVREKYGPENVAQIVTFARMNARAVVRDVGRAMAFPFGEMDRLAKLIPGGPKATLAAGLETEEVKGMLGQREDYRRLLEAARALEGLARHASTHAAGVVIAPPAEAGDGGGLRRFAPLLRLEGGDGPLVTQYDMDGIKHLGLIKIDLLGLKTLTVLDETRRLVLETRGETIDYLQVPLDDPDTFALFAEARTDGIFQFESSGMRDAMRKMHPDRLEDLIALNALYRPGPMEQIDTYIRRRSGQEAPEYDVPELEPILKDTFGIVVYQEQVIRIVHELAGYSMGKADEFRRSMGKKKAEIMAREEKTFIEGDKEKGIPGALARGIPRDKAERIYEFVEKFAGYGFNRSHSAAYALLAYWTAWLKTHHPVEFMAALLTSEIGNFDKVAEYVSECRKLKLPVLAPDVNTSGSFFSVERVPVEGNGGTKAAVRFGLAAVKNVGESATALMVKARETGGPFASLYDFCERMDLGMVNRKVLESLIKCGAFDSLGGRREQLLAILGQALERGSRKQDDRKRGQESLFGADTAEADIPLPQVDETIERNRLSYEKELLGCYVSGHPLAEYEPEIAQLSTISLSPAKIEAAGANGLLKIAGVVTHVKHGLTKKKEPYARYQIEDLEGSIEALAWPEVIKRSGKMLANGALLLVTGTLQRQAEGRPTLITKELMPLAEAQVRLTRGVHLHLSTVGMGEEVLRTIREVASMSPGEAALYLHLATLHHGEAVLEANPSLRVRPTRELVGQLRALLGDENVRLSDKPYTPAPA
ncbi:MAG: DNA polymerase III subunit alpha [Candidatus Coatesbacteria bacterium]